MNNKYCKNPFNYIGSKYKILEQIYPLFPKDCDTIIDLFGGSGEVGFNSEYKKIIYNEKCTPLVNVMKNIDDKFIEEVRDCIKKWNLGKFNKEEFLNLRKYYNENLKNLNNREAAVVVYALLTHAFNYQIAFNSKYEFNSPSGYARSWFNPSLAKKLYEYAQLLDGKNITFLSMDFNEIDIIDKNTFYYCDPPYLITMGSYEKDYFCKWSENKERELLKYLDELNNQNIKFALSNVLHHKGKNNTILQDWCSKYNVFHLNNNYNNCNYQLKTSTNNTTDEVLITNY